MGLKGKVAIVTGGAQGIGKQLALGLLGEGARVLVADRVAPKDEAKPSGKAAGETMFFQCNVTVEQEVDAMVKAAIDKWGRVDILVNNAGVGSYLPFMEVTPKHWDLVIAVNLRGPFLCTKAVLQGMIAQKSGSIINISSHAADSIFSMTMPKQGEQLSLMGSAYGVSKIGLDRLTISLAAEMGKYNIAVNAVRPARPVLTEGLAAQRKDADLTAWVNADSMSKAVRFLATQNAKGCTGVILSDEEYILRHAL